MRACTVVKEEALHLSCSHLWLFEHISFCTFVTVVFSFKYLLNMARVIATGCESHAVQHHQGYYGAAAFILPSLLFRWSRHILVDSL